jgi:N-acyl-D-aspartate/D-glutamate deacylase
LAFYWKDAPAMKALLRGSLKNGELGMSEMVERSITMRVGELGNRLGWAMYPQFL